jgi:ribonuclease P protein component
VRQPFILQMCETPLVGVAGRSTEAGTSPPAGPDSGQSARIGFTASRKIGGAVARNRAKRRLRAAAAAVMPGRVAAGHDYVLVARSSVLTCTFADLVAELISALDELARRQAAPSRTGRLVGRPSAPASITP